MPISRSLVVAALLAISATANANCSLSPYFAPALPALEKTSYAQVVALGPQRYWHQAICPAAIARELNSNGLL